MTSTTAEQDTTAQATIAADPKVPMIHITRDFRASPAQLLRAHTDPDLVARWIGPANREFAIDYWDARSGGSWRYLSGVGDNLAAFHGCFHQVSDDRLVQTFTWEGMPQTVSLETMTFADLGDGRTRLHATSLLESFETRDGWLAGGMAVGINDGYAKLDALLAAGHV